MIARAKKQRHNTKTTIIINLVGKMWRKHTSGQDMVEFGVTKKREKPSENERGKMKKNERTERSNNNNNSNEWIRQSNIKPPT